MESGCVYGRRRFLSWSGEDKEGGRERRRHEDAPGQAGASHKSSLAAAYFPT